MVRRVHNYADGGKIVKDHLIGDDGRPRVGEADQATRRKFLNQRLNERQPAPSRPAPAPAAAPSTGGGVSPNAARLLRDRGRQIDKAVDKFK